MKYLLTVLLLPISLMAHDISIECPTCHDHIIIKTEPKISGVKAGRGFWGETWVCPNSACGYENYVEIKYCALCGTKQP